MNKFAIIEKTPGLIRIIDTGEDFRDADQAVTSAKNLGLQCKTDGVEYGVFQLVGGFKVNVDTFVETFFP
jgi:hypothetical protein